MESNPPMEFLRFSPENADAPRAWMIVPKTNPRFYQGGDGVAREIHHQFGCASCRHFGILGRAEPITDPEFIERLERNIGCAASENPFPPHILSSRIRIPVARVLGEALIQLADGRYIAIENCD